MKSYLSQFPHVQLTRRAFLVRSAIAVASLSLPLSAMAMSISSKGEDIFPAADFRELCAALAGGRVPALAEAEAYLAALQSLGMEKDLNELLKLVRSTPSGALDAAIKSAGLDTATNTIVAMVYSGMTGTGKNIRVITYTDALAWSALPYTKPNGRCGGEFGYWSQPPA